MLINDLFNKALGVNFARRHWSSLGVKAAGGGRPRRALSRWQQPWKEPLSPHLSSLKDAIKTLNGPGERAAAARRETEIMALIGRGQRVRGGHNRALSKDKGAQGPRDWRPNIPNSGSRQRLILRGEGTRRKNVLTFVPLQEAFVRPLRGPQPGGFRAAGLEVRAAGRRACERTGLYCYKFHHLSQKRKTDGSVLGAGGGRGLLFAFNGVIPAQRELDSHRSDQAKPPRRNSQETAGKLQYYSARNNKKRLKHKRWIKTHLKQKQRRWVPTQTDS